MKKAHMRALLSLIFSIYKIICFSIKFLTIKYFLLEKKKLNYTEALTSSTEFQCENQAHFNWDFSALSNDL